MSLYVLCHLTSQQSWMRLHSLGQDASNVTGVLCATTIAMLGGVSFSKLKKMSLFLLFPCQYIFQSYTSYAIQLQFSDKAETRLWICEYSKYVNIPNVNILNVNYLSRISFYHTQWWYTWEWWRASATVILPSEWWCVNTTRTGLQVGLHSQAYHWWDATYMCCFHRMFYEDILFPCPSWLRCFCFHPAWTLVVVEKSGKKYCTFPDLHSLTACISAAL